MIEHYAQIKLLHVTCALVSGTLFALRAIGVHLGGRWPMAAPVRHFSYANDTLLLAAAVLLMSVTHQYPLVQSWLTVKLLLVIIYIVLGSFGLRRAPSRRARILCTLAALLTFVLILAIARTHSPWGPLAYLLRPGG